MELLLYIYVLYTYVYIYLYIHNMKVYIYRISVQFFGSTELENGLEKSKHFITNWLKAFLSDTPKSTKRQNKGPKEHDEIYIPSF